MPAGHAPGPRQEGGGWEPRTGGDWAGESGRASWVAGGQERREGSGNARRSRAGRNTQKTHGGGGRRGILLFFSAFLYFTNVLPPTGILL